MFSKHFFYKSIFLQFTDGRMKIGRKRLDSSACFFFLLQFIDIFRHFFRWLNFISDTVNSGCKTYRKGQIRIGCRVRAAQFHTGFLSPGSRNTDERAAVCRRPCNITWCLISRYQPLIGIYQRIHDKSHTFHVLHDTANKIIGFFTQAHFSIRIVENIMSIFGQGHIDMHSGTINPVFRLRHKACKQTVPLGNCLDNQFECHDIICRLQCLIILKVNLMLCGCYLMVGSFDLIPHIFKCQHHITSGIFSQVYRTEIKISGFFVGKCCRLAILILMEQEKLALRSHIKCISKVFCFLNLTL